MFSQQHLCFKDSESCTYIYLRKEITSFCQGITSHSFILYLHCITERGEINKVKFIYLL